jgi:hypothetical protein
VLDHLPGDVLEPQLAHPLEAAACRRLATSDVDPPHAARMSATVASTAYPSARCESAGRPGRRQIDAVAGQVPKVPDPRAGGTKLGRIIWRSARRPCTATHRVQLVPDALVLADWRGDDRADDLLFWAEVQFALGNRWCVRVVEVAFHAQAASTHLSRWT